MYKYAQLKRFHCERRLQVYMPDLMYVDPETMPVEDHFPATKTYVVNRTKISAAGPVPKHCLAFSYIRAEDNELDYKFDDKE